MKAKIQPLGERVLIQVDEAMNKTPGGLHLPDMAKEKPKTGKVLAVGTGRVRDDGTTVPFSVKLNDKILFAKYAFEPLPDSENLGLLRESDILAVIVD